MIVVKSPGLPPSKPKSRENFYHVVKLLGKNNVCYTCRDAKTADRKHCDICGHCILRFDHHCYYISNCVGQQNVCFFLAFLFNLFIILISELTTNILISLKIHFSYQRNFDLIYLLTGYEIWKDDKTIEIVRWVYSALLFIFAVSVFCLLAFTTRSVITNVTTYERFKSKFINKTSLTSESEIVSMDSGDEEKQEKLQNQLLDST